MKKYFIYAAAALALASCANDDFLGNKGPTEETGNGEITFGAFSPNLTRAGEITGKTAAEKIGNQFTVYGYKSAAAHAEDEATFDASHLTAVFPFYRVNYVDNSAYTTESNSHSWEYVGSGDKYTTNPVGVNGGTAADAANQSIKYWDYAANHYDFLAWAIASANANLESLSTKKDLASDPKVYNLVFNTPNAASLGDVYVANRVTIETKNATPSDEPSYTTGTTGRTDANQIGNYVLFNFRNMAAKVRLGIYETIPGYSVSDVKFYYDGSNKITGTQEASATEATSTLYAVSSAFATGGKLSVYYKDYNTSDATNSNVAVAATSASDAQSFITFGNLTGFKGAEYKEAAGSYIGRTSNEATMSTGKITGENYTYVFPMDATELNLKVDFTLTSVDGSGEILKVEGANAKVPAGYANWLSNYAYTYIFKISDNTNGQIGGHEGLYPITFDALVVDMVDANTQETITEVARTSSITTYQKGSEVTKESEYKVTTPISVVVDGGVALTDKIKLYTVKNLGTEQTTEEVIANYSNNKVVLTDITTGNLTIKDTYAAADGNNKTVGTNMVAEFVPVAGYDYAVKYTAGAGVETWKFINVVGNATAAQTYALSAAPTVNVGGTTTFTMTANYNGSGSYSLLGASKALVSTNDKLTFSENAGTITVNAASDALGTNVATGSATVTLNGVAPSNNTITIQGWTLSDFTVDCGSTGNTVTLKLNNTDNTAALNVADFTTSNAGITVTAASGATVTFSVASTVPAGTYTIKYQNAVATINVEVYSFNSTAYYINGIGNTADVKLSVNNISRSNILIDSSVDGVAADATTNASGVATFTSLAKGITTLSKANAKATLEVTNFNVEVANAIKQDKSDFDTTATGYQTVASGSTISGSTVLYVKLMDGTDRIASSALQVSAGTLTNAGSTGLYKLVLPNTAQTVYLNYTYKGQTFTLWTCTVN